MFIKRFETAFPYLDILIPLSLLGFGWERSGNPAGMIWILYLWCGLKFATHLRQNALYGILIGVLVVCLSGILHPISISAQTDLILVLLAFAAGLKQTNTQWRISCWCLLATLIAIFPFLEWDRFNDNLHFIPFESLREFLPQEAIRIQKITINRSGYLFGLFSLVGYGLFRFETKRGLSKLALGLSSLSYLLVLITGSRAALFFPLIAVLITEIFWRYKQMAIQRANMISMSLIVIALIGNLIIFIPHISTVYTRSSEDEARSKIALCFFDHARQSFPRLMTGQGYDRASNYCSQTKALGVRHAHNTFLQTLGDHGLISLTLMIIGIYICFQNLLIDCNNDNGFLFFIAFSSQVFILSSALIESTVIKTSLQQVITGYLFAMSFRSTSRNQSKGKAYT